MSQAEELFNQAYKLSVVEEKHREAIELCREALKLEPDNYRVLVYLGMLLGDHGRGKEIGEARQLFVTAIEKAKSASAFCTTWPEEAAIHHLGVWEWSQDHYLEASLFFLIDSLICRNQESRRSLTQLLAEHDLPIVRDIKLVLQKIMNEYQLLPRQADK
jgi:tetratricopeptide (TPR) repeat protein